jgi:hypothetical protein
MTPETTFPPAPRPPAPQKRTGRRRMRHFLLMQLLPVTVGILIALLIDGVIELARHRALVREAHAALAAEIAGNSSDLDVSLTGLVTMEGNLRTIAELVDDILNTGKTNITEFEFGLEFPSLDRANFQSAERTGALGYMKFSEVKEYSELYALQHLVEDSQRDLMARMTTLGVITRAMDSGDPEGYAFDLQNSRKDVANFQFALYLHSALAHTLADAYRRLPCKLNSACTQEAASP